jgi:hypothetical protein
VGRFRCPLNSYPSLSGPHPRSGFTMDSVPTGSTQSWIVVVTVAASPVILLRLADTLNRFAAIHFAPPRHYRGQPSWINVLRAQYRPTNWWKKPAARDNRARRVVRHKVTQLTLASPMINYNATLQPNERKAVHAETMSRSVTAVPNFPLRSELNCSLLNLLTPQGTSTLVSREPTMMNWPQFLVRADDWATGFLTGAAATSVIVFAGAAVLLLVHGV